MLILYNHSPSLYLTTPPHSTNHSLMSLLLPPSSLTTFSSIPTEKLHLIHRYGRETISRRGSAASAVSSAPQGRPVAIRRQTEYHPTLWDHGFIQSLPPPNEEFEASNKRRLEALKEKVGYMFRDRKNTLQKIILVDAIQCFGLDYHFEKEIQETLQQVYYDNDVDDNLYATSLRFRLLRQEGYHIPCDVFNKFKDKDGKFVKPLRSDWRGLLSLYEASHYSIDGEDILEEALIFSSDHLKSMCTYLDPPLVRHIQHSLSLSLHKGMSRRESMYCISLYEEDASRNDVLLELAKLDFNLTQSLHQREIKEVSKWHKDMDFVNKLAFGRDRVVESHAWALEMNFLPQFSTGRIALSKFYVIIALLDDTYDAYGTLDELELFTAAIHRWDVPCMDQLPYYMKLLYLATYNLFNEIEYMSLRDRGNSVIYYLKKTLGEYCKALMQEARWFYDGRVPSFDEYLSVASTTGAGPIFILISTVGMGELTTIEALEYIGDSKLLGLITLNARLINDLGTSKDEQNRGDAIKSIQCYMKEKGISEKEARKCIKDLIEDTWREINKELLKPTSLPKTIVKGMVNYVRLCETFYLNSTDGFGNSKTWTMNNIDSLFFKPLPM